MAAARDGAFEIHADGSVTLGGATLAADEVEILATPRPGTAVAHDEGLVVVIDTSSRPSSAPRATPGSSSAPSRTSARTRGSTSMPGSSCGSSGCRRRVEPLPRRRGARDAHGSNLAGGPARRRSVTAGDGRARATATVTIALRALAGRRRGGVTDVRREIGRRQPARRSGRRRSVAERAVVAVFLGLAALIVALDQAHEGVARRRSSRRGSR